MSDWQGDTNGRQGTEPAASEVRTSLPVLPISGKTGAYCFYHYLVKPVSDYGYNTMLKNCSIEGDAAFTKSSKGWSGLTTLLPLMVPRNRSS